MGDLSDDDDDDDDEKRWKLRRRRSGVADRRGPSQYPSRESRERLPILTPG